MSITGKDTLKTKRKFKIGNKNYEYFSLKAAEKALRLDFSRLPYSLKILMENLLRFEDDQTINIDDIKALGNWSKKPKGGHEIQFRPARVLMQDFTGVPAVVDLAAMREAVKESGGKAENINPLSPVDLVIDHSVMVDKYGTQKSFKNNVELEYKRNIERYEFLRWGQSASDNFRVVPPGTGICHQVNLEYLANVVWTKKNKKNILAYPDTLVGTDSHTTMINGLAVLGWGVGGIEAEAAMLGQPISMLIPDVVGFYLKGKLKEGSTATDLVLTITEELRKKGVVGKFVEFFGPGLDELSLADRATISNMAPEYGATCGFFPIDSECINYLKITARKSPQINLVEKYAKLQGMWRSKNSIDPVYTDVVKFDISSVEPSLAGPKRPQDRVLLSNLSNSFKETLKSEAPNNKYKSLSENDKLTHGDIVIAAITSCTNTSNPAVMLGAGLLAKNAVKKGLKVKPWVKTSLAPGSKVVTEYLTKSGLQAHLNKLGFNLVGYGCTTCIGNSGPLSNSISKEIIENKLITASVLSGNRNFEGRVSPLTRVNYLASPILVVAYALSGNVRIDLMSSPIGKDLKGREVFLKDIWPDNDLIRNTIKKIIKPKMYKDQYAKVFEGDAKWKSIKVKPTETYEWDKDSTYVKLPPYFENITENNINSNNINNARMLALLGDSITTDHISPAGSIAEESPAGRYLKKNNVKVIDFNSYGARRGNHEVMMRGTFANIRLRNKLAPGTEGGVTTYFPDEKQMTIYDAAIKYRTKGVPLIIVAGKEYGTGSSRDWAAKGTSLLGVKAVIAESYERIHRSNLVGMGVLPLEFKDGDNGKSLRLTGKELFSLTGLDGKIKPKMDIDLTIKYNNNSKKSIKLLCRIDTENEIKYYMNKGILHYVLRSMME